MKVISSVCVCIGWVAGARIANGILTPCDDNPENCLVAVVSKTRTHKGCRMRFLGIDESLVAIVNYFEEFPDLQLPCAYNVAWWNNRKPASA